MMNKVEKLLDYLFSLKGSLNQKSYFFHYFLDLFLFFVLIILLSFSAPFLPSYIENTKIFDMSLTVIYFVILGILIVALLAMNRLSISLRRLNYLKLNPVFSLLLFLPLVGQLFDLYLLLKRDYK